MARDFPLDFYEQSHILKVGFVLKLRCRFHHVGAFGYPFGDIQNWQIFGKKFTRPRSWQIIAFSKLLWTGTRK